MSAMKLIYLKDIKTADRLQGAGFIIHVQDKVILNLELLGKLNLDPLTLFDIHVTQSGSYRLSYRPEKLTKISHSKFKDTFLNREIYLFYHSFRVQKDNSRFLYSILDVYQLNGNFYSYARGAFYLIRYERNSLFPCMKSWPYSLSSYNDPYSCHSTQQQDAVNDLEFEGYINFIRKFYDVE